MNTRFTLLGGALAVGALVCFTAATAQTSTETQSTKKSSSASKMSAKSSGKADAGFVKKAAEGGMAEVELGRLAADKGANADVKQFGQRMVDDHSKANDELKSLAQQKGIDIPSDLSAKSKATKDRLSKLSGAAFDRAYMKEMVADHNHDVAEFQKEAKGGKDSDVKSWAEKTLPTIQDHQKMAKEDNAKLSGTSTRSKSSSPSKTSS